MIYGYVRVSTKGQAKDGNSIEDQTDLILKNYPTAKIVVESHSGAKERPLFGNLISSLNKDDILVVTKLDRFCRTTKEGLIYIDDLMNRGVKIHMLNMGLIENTPMGRLIVTNLLAFAEFERAMIIERTQAGKAIAKSKPDYKEGRPKKELPLFENFLIKQKEGKISISEACRQLGISRTQWYRLAT